MDVQINASYESETSSLSVIEGMSAGVPSAVSDCGGNPDLIADGVNGFVFPARDSVALAACVRKMVSDPSLCGRLKDGALRVYEERFTGKKFAESVEAVYEKLMR